MRNRRIVVAVLAVVLLGAAWVDACCMVPRDYPGDVDQSAQHALVLHHDCEQELVLRVRPFFHHAEFGRLLYAECVDGSEERAERLSRICPRSWACLSRQADATPHV